MCSMGIVLESMLGVYHAARLAALDARHGGSIIDAQITRAVADAPWSPELLADIESITVDDFDLEAGGPHRHIDDSLDLVAIAVRA